MRSSLSRIDAIGRFENVIPVGTAVPGGVEILFRLVPRHPITRLVVRGETGLPAETLRQQVQQRYGGVPSTDRPTSVAAAATQLLRDAGYLDAAVQHEIELTHDPEGATLILNVRAGAVSTIAGTTVDLRGVQVLSPDDVIERTRTQAGVPFRRRDIESSLTDLEDYFRGRGYYVVQAAMQSERTADGVLVRLIVDTGPRVEVVVRPDGVLPTHGHRRSDSHRAAAIGRSGPARRLARADRDALEARGLPARVGALHAGRRGRRVAARHYLRRQSRPSLLRRPRRVAVGSEPSREHRAPAHRPGFGRRLRRESVQCRPRAGEERVPDAGVLRHRHRADLPAGVRTQRRR